MNANFARMKVLRLKSPWLLLLLLPIVLVVLFVVATFMITSMLLPRRRVKGPREDEALGRAAEREASRMAAEPEPRGGTQRLRAPVIEAEFTHVQN